MSASSTKRQKERPRAPISRRRRRAGAEWRACFLVRSRNTCSGESSKSYSRTRIRRGLCTSFLRGFCGAPAEEPLRASGQRRDLPQVFHSFITRKSVSGRRVFTPVSTERKSPTRPAPTALPPRLSPGDNHGRFKRRRTDGSAGQAVRTTKGGNSRFPTEGRAEAESYENE
jgi:hypothetical protein